MFLIFIKAWILRVSILTFMLHREMLTKITSTGKNILVNLKTWQSDTILHNILEGKFRKCVLDEWAVRWIKNRLNGRAQRVVSSRAESTWKLYPVMNPRDQ